jgi:hypothetical protein
VDLEGDGLAIYEEHRLLPGQFLSIRGLLEPRPFLIEPDLAGGVSGQLPERGRDSLLAT